MCIRCGLCIMQSPFIALSLPCFIPYSMARLSPYLLKSCARGCGRCCYECDGACESCCLLYRRACESCCLLIFPGVFEEAPPEVDDPRSAHETELARVRAEADARAAANAEELERLRAEKARVDAEAELARVRARGDAEAAAAAREIERLRAEIEASRSAGAAAATANPIAQAAYQPELPTVAGTVSPIGRVVGVVRGWSSSLVGRRPSTASATTPPPTCEVVDVESPAPKAETMKRPPPAGAPPRGLPWGALPPAGVPPRGPPRGAPPPPA